MIARLFSTMTAVAFVALGLVYLAANVVCTYKVASLCYPSVIVADVSNPMPPLMLQAPEVGVSPLLPDQLSIEGSSISRIAPVLEQSQPPDTITPADLKLVRSYRI